MFWRNTLVSIVLLAFIISLVNSVTITCKSNYELRQYCVVRGLSVVSSLTRTSPENPRFNCLKGRNFGIFKYRPSNVYLIWVYLGCGGTFSVTSSGQPSWERWSPWSACSTSCGGGRQTRSRTCSTGFNKDCSTQGNSMKSEIRTCMVNACGSGSKINDVSITSICGMIPLKIQDRVIGGQVAENCQFPWAVYFENVQTGGFCGGSIIDDRHILTAAHCVVSKNQFGQVITQSPRDIKVYTGSSTIPQGISLTAIPGIKVRKVSKVTVHEDYAYYYLENDIALLTLTDPINFDKCHVPICLATTHLNAATSGCQIAGWGTTSNDPNIAAPTDLRYTDLEIVDGMKCFDVIDRFDGEKQICVAGNGHSSCNGDSGGALFCPDSDGRYHVHGVVSGGAEEQCGTSESYYSRVPYYRSWIENNTK